MTIPSLTMLDGREVPAVGFGTYPHAGDDSRTTAVSALDAGYRLLDTALRYENEQGVGRAVREYDLPREEILVATKLAGRHHGYDETLEGFQESLDNLGLDYVDLYLVHWPLPRLDKYVDSWKAMIRLREEGLARSIGVSKLHRGPPAPAGRRDRRGPGAEPGRDAPVLPAGRAAGGARGTGHRHRELEPD